MSKKRTQYSSEFKAKVALAAIQGGETIPLLSWRLSGTMDADFCIQALQAATQDHGCPQIFNTDQGAGVDP
ncbi:MAG: hypothetical protein IT524_08105 [Nitrosomonas sp.]|nr:hypothetical protein [Nitrosomonas sp.]